VIRVEVCDDMDYVKEVIMEDEMWDRCADDYTVKDPSIIDRMGCIWLKCFVDEKSSGVVSLHHSSTSVADIHIYIPKNNRGKNTKDIGHCVLNWVKDNAVSTLHKLNTKIPVIYKDVIRFAHSIGFENEGYDRRSIMKNGELIDRVCLGLSISEIKT